MNREEREADMISFGAQHLKGAEELGLAEDEVRHARFRILRRKEPEGEDALIIDLPSGNRVIPGVEIDIDTGTSEGIVPFKIKRRHEEDEGNHETRKKIAMIGGATVIAAGVATGIAVIWRHKKQS